MDKILKISAGEIDDSLTDSTRQYLVGDLQRPERLRHIASSLVEIGITRYGEDGGTEPTHTHTQAFEFQYMTAGLTAYLNTITREEHIFRKGDFYVIEPGRGIRAKVRPKYGDSVHQIAAGKRQGTLGHHSRS